MRETLLSSHRSRRFIGSVVLCVTIAGLVAGCSPYTTKRDKTAKGAGVGAVAGAAASVIRGKREADEILAHAAVGAAIGAGVGAYMDSQEEKIARIPGTRVERVSDDVLLVHFDSDILFTVDSWTLTPSSRGTLDELAQVLNEFNKTAIVVQGHTDSTGSEDHNQTLSERRAEAVKAYLATRGIDATRMAAFGYGEGMPRAGNESASGRQMNRRVDILLKAKA